MAAKKKALRVPEKAKTARGAKPAARRSTGAAPSTSATRGSAVRLGDGERVAREPEHTSSPTAVAAEAMRTGVIANAVPHDRDDDAIPGEGPRMRAGDPDDETLRNEYVGEETPGGSTPTPDQGNVDDIGRAYGVQEEDSGELRTSTEVMEGRDLRRRGVGVKRRNT